MSNDERAIKLHARLRGKLEMKSKAKVTQKNLQLLYTPGVAAVSKAIAKKKSLVFDYTNKWNSIAIVSDGSRVLGLGNIGPEAALPVMEGKAIIFKTLGNVDAIPLCLETQKTKEIVETVKRIAPVFGGINLEDIDAPKCFEIEEKLIKALDIPVFHDDQHGTAVVTAAALENALRATKRNSSDVKIVVAGAGAAGIAIVKLLSHYKFKDIIAVDSKGAIYKGRKAGMSKYKKEIAKITNVENVQDDIRGALVNADVVIGVSGIPGMLKPQDIKLMTRNPIVFALTNPGPEIMPTDAKKAGAAIVGTGRSDFPNQINNSLVFPGFFRGLLDARSKRVTDEMKLNATHALARLVRNPTKNRILPNTTDRKVVKAVSKAVYNTAKR